MIQAENPTRVLKDLPKPPDSKVPGFTPTAKAGAQGNNLKNQGTNNLGQLSNSQPPTQQINPHRGSSFTESFYHWWHKIALILLMLHGLNGLWESIRFIAIEFKELEYQLAIHTIMEEEVNMLVARSIVVAITTFINLFMAFRLNSVKETTAHNIDLFVATALVITTPFIQNILIQFDLLGLFIKLFGI